MSTTQQELPILLVADARGCNSRFSGAASPLGVQSRTMTQLQRGAQNESTNEEDLMPSQSVVSGLEHR